MKKKQMFRSNVLSFILGGIICGSIGVGAVSYFTADNVEFIPTDSSWNVTNVNEAIDSLYDKTNINSDNFSALQGEVTTAKTNFATAITSKGVSTSSSDSFETMISNVNKIKTDSDATMNIISKSVGSGGSGSVSVTVTKSQTVYYTFGAAGYYSNFNNGYISVDGSKVRTFGQVSNSISTTTGSINVNAGSTITLYMQANGNSGGGWDGGILSLVYIQ